jgi:hypothetical protein
LPHHTFDSIKRRTGWPSRALRNRSALIVATLALGLALGGASASGAAGIHMLRCGALRGAWGLRYSIVADRATCTTARDVFVAFFARKGTRRLDPFTGAIDRVVDGWMCGGLPGGFSCTELGPHGTIPQQLGPNITAEVL